MNNSFLIRRQNPNDRAPWDTFVQGHPMGSPFHLTAWQRAIQSTFGYRNYSLIAQRGETIEAVLPLFLVSTPLTGKILLSTPFAVYGGVLASCPEALAAMKVHLEELSHSLGVQHTELRNMWQEQCLGWQTVDRYATFTQDIGATDEAILAAMPRETRRMTRRAIENNFTAVTTQQLGPFEKLYIANLRKLGTPAFPHKHFVNLMREFGEQADVREIMLEGKVVAAVLSFYYRGQVLPYYGASDPAYNRANTNNYMYYDVLCEARRRGLKTFDFGRSKKGSGSYSFKSHWGMTERTLPYEFFLVKRKELPNFSPTNPKYERAIELWQKLPVWLTRAIGPFLIRMFP